MNSLFIRNRDGKLSLMLRVRRESEIDLRFICRLSQEQAAYFASHNIDVVPVMPLNPATIMPVRMQGKALIWGDEILARDLCQESLASLKPLIAA